MLKLFPTSLDYTSGVRSITLTLEFIHPNLPLDLLLVFWLFPLGDFSVAFLVAVVINEPLENAVDILKGKQRTI
jgi:hypothetical protein